MRRSWRPLLSIFSTWIGTELAGRGEMGAAAGLAVEAAISTMRILPSAVGGGATERLRIRPGVPACASDTGT